ncbi:longevity assurance proteins LAG1/LAC1 [Hypoxylon trugodes]|uniref:longevity assurance proteins LAG1/LAC1 n=1 Tax=Hypoxylon trugodes TaxID=326681 RepID=UPI00219223CF|nr:longevity assurance proteins LAG1/LAC1 [Hypoxylon trugodes]KAI1382666.1 longevity assurance proteins LAG1/LAC1 [Hypoxylon trugodes]
MAVPDGPTIVNALDHQSPSARNGASKQHKKSSSNETRSKRLSKRRKTRSLLRQPWTIPFALLLAFILLYSINPTESNVIHNFIFLSYKLENDGPAQYGKGPWDIAFVCFYTIVLSFAREFIMHELLRPLARLGGIKSQAKQPRFMEQMYVAVYITFMGPLGMYCMKRTPVWYFNTRGMYESFPHKTHDAWLKFYYLFQAAFWSQQALVMLLGIEKRRKDFKELVAHHIITIALIALSYRFHFTYMGIAVYVTHDISDFFLAISKSLNYIGSPLQGPSFGFCIIIWTYLRHYINLRILYSTLTEFRTVGPYGIDWETEQYKGLLSNVVTFGLLAMLQALNLFWLYCLLRNAYRFIFHGIAKDDRSEDEEPEVDITQQKASASKNEAFASAMEKHNATRRHVS